MGRPRGRPRKNPIVTDEGNAGIPLQQEEVGFKKNHVNKIDLGNGPGKLVLFLSDNDFSESVKNGGGQWINIREYFYTKFLPDNFVIPKYPVQVTDGFINRLVSFCIGTLHPMYKYNRARIAISKYSGRTLRESGDFFRLVDKILTDNFKEFFTFNLKFPESGIWVLSGIKYKFESDYLKLKFKNVETIGYNESWAEKKIDEKTTSDEFLEAICA